MTPRLLYVALAPLFAAATAHAQAPGDWTPEPSYAQPPPVVAPQPAPQVRKWSIGATAGQTDLSPKEYPDQTAQFDTASLALRYRGWRHLELELTIGGGSQTQADNTDRPGDLAMSTGTLAARYRFNPENKWNWWLLAGLGVTTVAPASSSDEQIKAAQRPHGTIGVGLERRWTRFALQFELRALSVGQTQDEMTLADQGVMTTKGLSGGNFAFGASYYF
jgi:hypothetical protein